MGNGDALEEQTRMISKPFIYFLTVARCGQITKAAEQLNMSQPALSRQIASIEKQFGTFLFNREGRGLRLNEAGEILERRIAKAVHELEEASREIESLRSNRASLISVGFLGTLGVSVVPALIREFCAFQKIPPTFHLTQGSWPSLREQLEQGEISLCFGAPEFPGNQFRWTPLYSEDLFLVVAADHALAKRGGIDLHEVADLPMIVLKEQFGLRQLTDELCRKAGFEPNIAFEADEVATLRGLVGAKIGVAIAPRSVWPQTSLTVDLNIREPVAKRTIGLSERAGQSSSAASRRFRDFVIEKHRKGHE
jgi:DNA-binding transcriptional LysR family regulator